MVRLNIVYLVRLVSQHAGLSLWHLAETLRGQQQVEEAERHARESLRIWQTAFGAEHEWTAWGRISLAEARLARGDAAEAALQAERAAAALERIYGPAHAVTSTTLTLCARPLIDLNRADEALTLVRRVGETHLRQAGAGNGDEDAIAALVARAQAALGAR